MVKWIHVITATKLPIPRGGSTSPYENYDDGFDPNDGTPFGPDQDSMFLQVVEVVKPVVNEVLEKVERVETVGADGKTYHGSFVDPEWVQGWTVATQDIEVSRNLKIQSLESDRDVFIQTGYTVGSFQFPLTEHFFRLLADRLRWLEDAVEALEVPSNTELTFSDLVDKEVSVGLVTLKNHFIQFGKEYLGMYEKEVDARNQIQAATTPTEVNAVAWVF